MLRNNDFRFLGFVTEAIPTIGNETVPNTYERLLKFNNHVNTFITLPGGFKTLEEIFIIASLTQQNKYEKSFGLLNLNNFYNMLLFFLDGSVFQGFLFLSARRIVVHANIANELIDLLQAYRPDFIPTTSLYRSDDDKGKTDDLVIRMMITTRIRIIAVKTTISIPFPFIHSFLCLIYLCKLINNMNVLFLIHINHRKYLPILKIIINMKYFSKKEFIHYDMMLIFF